MELQGPVPLPITSMRSRGGRQGGYFKAGQKCREQNRVAVSVVEGLYSTSDDAQIRDPQTKIQPYEQISYGFKFDMRHARSKESGRCDWQLRLKPHPMLVGRTLDRRIHENGCARDADLKLHRPWLKTSIQRPNWAILRYEEIPADGDPKTPGSINGAHTDVDSVSMKANSNRVRYAVKSGGIRVVDLEKIALTSATAAHRAVDPPSRLRPVPECSIAGTPEAICAGEVDVYEPASEKRGVGVTAPSMVEPYVPR
ncbi:hypothetical protein SCHPADRAFT_893056 [Schizopora paradoxa]|uniref:Uncharacterized protein n=1 Tax=Schizopora paradoxa TaxID=27342 RepID=A0A0H2RCA8_9AGAM|nr:hypothetical protein SCHPADRAFT_893056 [Schizopora paradoxa]